MSTLLPICGTYFTDFGTLHLSLSGDHVEGTYPYQDGHLSGTLSDGRVKGTWVQKGNRAKGTFTFDFGAGANQFQGSWTDSDSKTGAWNGVRLKLPSQEEGGFPGGWNSHTDGPLLAGPLLGEVGECDARIWIQARSESPVTLVIEASNGEIRRFVQTPSWSEWLCDVFYVGDLSPDLTYTYWFENEHGQTPVNQLPLAPSAKERAVRIAFGACFKWYLNQDLVIFDSIAAEKPNYLAMIGDNAYYFEPDWQSEHTMMMAQLRSRNNRPFQRVAAGLPTVGIWDDHDFGPNDTDNRFVGKDMSLRTFRRSWANANWGTGDVMGVFSSVRIGPVELFLLDSRWHRNDEARSMLGPQQLAWLLDALARSTADVKIVASPSQVLAQTAVKKGWDCFHRDAPKELDELLSQIEARDIRGVVFVSGDLHMANLFHQQGRAIGNGRGPEWWELTTSPLGNEPWMDSLADEDPNLVAECFDSCNYGLVDVNLDRAGAEVILICKNDRGVVMFEQPIALDTLALRR